MTQVNTPPSSEAQISAVSVDNRAETTPNDPKCLGSSAQTEIEAGFIAVVRNAYHLGGMVALAQLDSEAQDRLASIMEANALGELGRILAQLKEIKA